MLQAAIPHKTKFTGVIRQSNAHHPGLCRASQIRHVQMVEKVNINAIMAIFTKSPTTPEANSEIAGRAAITNTGHQCIFARRAINTQWAIGIHASHANLSESLFATIINVREV